MRTVHVVLLTALGLVLTGSCTSRPQPLASQVVGAEGAHMTAPGMALDIPAGALSGEQTISIFAADPPNDGTTSLSKAYRFEPAGLQFAKPITVKLDVPAGSSGIVRWTRFGDESSWDFSGTIDDGVAIAESTHFSDASAAQLDPDDFRDEVPGDLLCTKNPNKQDCRKLCECIGSDPTLSDPHLCGSQPQGSDPLCPQNPKLPEIATGEEQFGEQDGDACTGWAWVPTTIYTCTCSANVALAASNPPSPTPLCPLAETKDPSGAWGCHSTLSWPFCLGPSCPPTGPAPKTPVMSECVSGTSDRRLCDFSWWSYVGTSATDTNGCFGKYKYTDASGALVDMDGHGKLDSCGEAKINYTWQPFSGKTAKCHSFDADPKFPDPTTGEDLERCLLTKKQWSDLKQRRVDCGLPPDPWTVAGFHVGSPVEATLAILSVPGESAFPPAKTDITGVSSKSWDTLVNCASHKSVEKNWSGIGNTYPQKTKGKETGKFLNNNTTKTHAEGDALLQLAEQRGRLPNDPNPSDPTAAWGVKDGSGRVGGCAEMLVDRKACTYACAPEGVYHAMEAAGLDKLIVHSPGGCRLFQPNGLVDGVPCYDAEACP